MTDRPEDLRTAPIVLIRFYDDDHGPCCTYEAGTGVTTFPVPPDTEEMTVELVLPEPEAMTNAGILEAADWLVGNLGEAGSHITTTRSILAMAAERAREQGSLFKPEAMTNAEVLEAAGQVLHLYPDVIPGSVAQAISKRLTELATAARRMEVI